ncbi:MAG: 1-deoxy-D-xylulose-5-phosphate synthase [Clostridia bacterium]|nr:1-deoxy-D-xylulose-5-phosphate synthase [Clostridia bacterium]
MVNILEKVNMPDDLKTLNIREKEQLAEEIRRFIIDNVSNTGGHLASNLGVVELTIALHSVFNMPKDKMIWDVGHQTYVHKILTGRKDKFNTLRQLNGLAGFPKTSESEFDSFNTGHSSTSISTALGMARARDIKKENNSIIAIIGDGALTGGMALEALNDAGCSNTNLIVILNDNEMSISRNVGGISMLLGKIRTKKAYTKSNQYLKTTINKVPYIGRKIVKMARKLKYGIKQLFIPNMFFEDLGFRYLGPIDGNNIEKVQDLLEIAKKVKGPVLVHVVTKKGKGYKIAEENPDRFHSTSSFDIKTGKSKKDKKADYSKVFGEKLVNLAKENKNIVAVTAAMCDGTGLSKFKKQYPDRFFDVGIAEQHALGLSAGMAKNGMIPVIPIYSSFYQRGYDQVIHDICLQNLPVIMCVDRAGIVGNDGETHQGILDLSFFSLVPNLTILAPKDFTELEQMLEFAVNLKKSIVIRYPRGGEDKIKFRSHKTIKLGEAEILKEGKDLTIVAIGKMVSRALEVSNLLEAYGISCDIINARFLKPFDEKTILQSINKTNKIITIEDGILRGGLATTVKELIVENNIKDIYIKSYGYNDTFVKHGSVEEIEKIYGLDVNSIVENIKNEVCLQEK